MHLRLRTAVFSCSADCHHRSVPRWEMAGQGGCGDQSRYGMRRAGTRRWDVRADTGSAYGCPALPGTGTPARETGSVRGRVARSSAGVRAVAARSPGGRTETARPACGAGTRAHAPFGRAPGARAGVRTSGAGERARTSARGGGSAVVQNGRPATPRLVRLPDGTWGRCCRYRGVSPGAASPAVPPPGAPCWRAVRRRALRCRCRRSMMSMMTGRSCSCWDCGAAWGVGAADGDSGGRPSRAAAARTPHVPVPPGIGGVLLLSVRSCSSG